MAMKYDVIAINRNGRSPNEALSKARWLAWNPTDGDGVFSMPDRALKLGAVVWAQGANCNDDIFSFDVKRHEETYAANVTYILVGLQILLKRDLIDVGARLCIISSIWQNIARQNKLSYCITKSALQGLVRSLSVDLGPSGYLVNAVLPGAMDSPMTRTNLSDMQIRRIENMTPLRKLPELKDVCNLVQFLCSAENTGITGQFIAADRGFSNARII